MAKNKLLDTLCLATHDGKYMINFCFCTLLVKTLDNSVPKLKITNYLASEEERKRSLYKLQSQKLYPEKKKIIDKTCMLIYF